VEVDLAEVSLHEDGIAEVSKTEDSIAEIGSAKVSSSQRRLWPPDLFHICILQICMIELNTCCIKKPWLSLFLIASQWKSLFEHHN